MYTNRGAPQFYTSLIRYYHEIGAHDEATGLFKEVIGDKEKKKRLKEDLYLYRDVFDSIKKSKALVVYHLWLNLTSIMQSLIY